MTFWDWHQGLKLSSQGSRLCDGYSHAGIPLDVFLETICTGERENRIEQREKLNCNEVATEAPADTLGDLLSGMAFQSCLN